MVSAETLPGAGVFFPQRRGKTRADPGGTLYAPERLGINQILASEGDV